MKSSSNIPKIHKPVQHWCVPLLYHTRHFDGQNGVLNLLYMFCGKTVVISVHHTKALENICVKITM